MRLIVFLLVAGVIIGVARALMPVLILTVIASLLWAVITRPLELLGFVTLLLMAESLSLRPVTTILCVAGVAAFALVRRPIGQSEKKNLTGGR